MPERVQRVMCFKFMSIKSVPSYCRKWYLHSKWFAPYTKLCTYDPVHHTCTAQALYKHHTYTLQAPYWSVHFEAYVIFLKVFSFFFEKDVVPLQMIYTVHKLSTYAPMHLMCTIQALYKHHTYTLQTLYKHCTDQYILRHM